MTYEEAMKELRKAGTAQNRKVYARHGVAGEMFGVSYANLGKLQKKIKQDDALARRLWASGNHDARVLAAKVADPEALKSGELDGWARDLDNYVVTDAFSQLAARSPFAAKKIEKWTKSKKEWIGRAGWTTLAIRAMGDDVTAAEAADWIPRIEAEIHTRPNRQRDAMNSALIAIGMKSAALEKKAVAAARRIGPVDVDHGETGCKTADAADMIRRGRARRKGR